MIDRFSRRTQLLTGVSAVLTLLGSPALAQAVDAGGSRSAINQQTSTAPTTVDTDQADMATQTGAVRASTATVADNSILASARANVADTSLDGEDIPSTATASPSSLSIAGRRVAADADRLVENSQTMAHAPVQSLALRGEVGIQSGAASSANLGVTGNALEASALGSQAADSLSLASGGEGGAIVSMQSGDTGSGVSALDTDTVRLAASTGSNSAFDLGANTVGADAIGNRVDDALSIQAGSVRASASGSPASFVPASGSDEAKVEALYADLGSQAMSGKVAATAGIAPASVALAVDGDLTGSSATVRDNVLSANATANRSSHALDLQAASIAGDIASEGPATVANVTNIQRDQGGDLVAATNGGTSAYIGGQLSSSTLDVSNNAQSATAFANRATGNLLTVGATTIDSSEPAESGPEPVGTAMTTSDGAASTTAAFSVQNVQETSGASVIATMTANMVGLDLGGPVDGSTIIANANTADSAATANGAVSGATVNGGTIRTSVDVNNSQTVDGQLRSNVGDATNRAGVTITPAASVLGSSLEVSGNALSGSTVGNNASSSLTVAAATLGNGSGHDDAVAGSLEGGYGAAADFALSNYQKLGQPVAEGSTSSGLATTVIGAFGIDGDGAARSSVLAVSDNSQSATSVGNTALDRVSLEAATIPADGVPVAGAALTSSQFGEGTVAATSDMQITGRSTLDSSSLSVTGNTNQAGAAMNDADNGLTVAAAQIGAASGGSARAEVGNLGMATITGDQVLANEQFASGNVAATARTSFLYDDAGMAGSRLDLSGNSAVADVSANHAVNSISVTAAGGEGADVGLANSQMNTASVAASSILDGSTFPAGTAMPTVHASSAAMNGNLSQAVGRGNSADNEVTLSMLGGTDTGIRPMATLTAFEADAGAPALLVSSQSNYGGITARAAGDFGIPLNASGSVSASALSATGNNVVANAYGNAANNKLMVGGVGGTPAAMLVNVQSNNAPISASVIGSTVGLRTGVLASSAVAVTGNQLAATAIGNIATNAISTAR